MSIEKDKQVEVSTMQPVAVAGGNITFQQMQMMAQSVAKSGLFGVKNADQALSLMMIAQAEGKHPAIVARDYNIISTDGGQTYRPSKTSEAIQRDFQAAGGRIEWHALTDEIADATFSHPQGGTIRIQWDTARAQRAGLVGKKGDMYGKYGRAMLRARVVSEGCRTVWPSSTGGMYTPQEIAELREQPEEFTGQTIDAAAETVAKRTAMDEAERTKWYGLMDSAENIADLMRHYQNAVRACRALHDDITETGMATVYQANKRDLIALDEQAKAEREAAEKEKKKDAPAQRDDVV